MKRISLILFLILPTTVFAQSWPIHENTGVNDYAGVIEDETEVRINRALQTLEEETGVQATVLTLFTRLGYEDAESLEEFSTGLFNHWGVGDASRNDGILILVVTQGKEMTIELGSGYPTAFNREASDIIQDAFLPAFKDERMSEGIEEGTDQILTHIARAHASGDAPSGGSGSGWAGWIFGGGVFAGLLALIFGRKIGDRVRKCPQCGARGIHRDKDVIQQATEDHDGKGRETTTCSNCDYRDTRNYSISRRKTKSPSDSSFGGGKSKGGGASGKW